ncbi:hypothetical protein [Bathymodiolus japonicus methanotrophic gill symbiont]|uniref:hypothetical protein n=1 Tax=Bathymodiolus japonicus methanotrophic gill symbiont TaxID=113269 RepID=UPI001C8F0D9F|nr:hypothetical protein [Bathymodiolus japonicus methanotrophic gill symbiont]
MATTNGSTAIRDKILASLARYRALRIGKFPCAFWRLSALPGLTALVVRLRSSPNFTPGRIFVLPFPVTLITLTLNQRNSRWLDNDYWKSSPKGHPSSFLQLRAKIKKIFSRGRP